MAVNSKPARRVRREQAARTRERILDAAYRLFTEDGYEPTTMQAIADASGVAVQTVYFRFGTKAALLREVEARAVLGGGDVGDWRSQPWATRMAGETDPHPLIRQFVEVVGEIQSRLSPLLGALGAAGFLDAASRAERERESDEFFRAFVDRLDSLGGLRDGLDHRRALDIVLVLNKLECFAELTGRRGWSLEEWRAWMVETLAAQLLPPPS